MKQSKKAFVKERVKAVGFSLKGIWILIKTESSFQIQISVAILATIAGFYFKISFVEWMVQLLIIALILVAEALNTGIEKIADFIHPDYHDKIGVIKDISAGAAGIAALISLFIAGLIYIPKIALLF